ncbi:hypothetical protein TNCT_330351 [Trichonephila clavata]|uniref:Uncharacterized protein n=1 Tax=Trichonephila clavata TaxID=2740835 RepID=A0A8X6GCH0_TRICU|nr:hypothetical protein TNCT_330351 [Trichonephila clavata]
MYLSGHSGKRRADSLSTAQNAIQIHQLIPFALPNAFPFLTSATHTCMESILYSSSNLKKTCYLSHQAKQKNPVVAALSIKFLAAATLKNQSEIEQKNSQG